jgi:hypothetical protein
VAEHARAGGGELRTWLGESHTAEYFYGHLISLSALASLPQPDGLSSWAEAGREVVFMLDYDTGSEHPGHLANKLDGYANLAEVSGTVKRRSNDQEPGRHPSANRLRPASTW